MDLSSNNILNNNLENKINKLSIFQDEVRTKTLISVHQNKAVVNDESYAFNIILGSCVSVVLCGADSNKKVWFGINHLFKSREENDDLSLHQIANMINTLEEKSVSDVHCLGVFGAAYRKGSVVKEIAKANLLTILEALSLYNLSVELFQTGYSQGLTVLKSNTYNSFMIKLYNIKEKETKITEIPLERVLKI